MKLAIFGATGLVGKVLVQRAVARGYKVQVLSRKPMMEGDLPAGVDVITGDYFDSAAVRQTLVGVDAVLSTIGPPQHRKTPLTPEDFERGMQQLVTEMESAGITRIINIASAGTRFQDEHYGWGRRCVRWLLGMVVPIVIPSKERELAVLANSSLEWTALRPPLIVSGIGKVLRVDDQATQGMRVDTELLADFMLAQLISETWVRRAPFVAS